VLPASLFLLLHFASLSHFHSCAHYCFIVLSRSHCLFLSHAFSLAFYLAFLLVFSLVRGVLPHVSLIVFCGFIHSIFAFFGFDRFSFGLISIHWFCSHYLQEVCFLIFVCLECFLDVCIIDVGFQNCLDEKTSNGHNF